MEVYFWVLESQTNRALCHLTGGTLQNVQYGGVRNTLSCIAFIKKSDLKNEVTKRNNDLQTIMSRGEASQQFKELKEILKETKQRILVLKLKINRYSVESLCIFLQNVNDITKMDEQNDRMRENYQQQ